MIPGKDLVNNDHPQVVEIWNLVLCNSTEKLMAASKIASTACGYGNGF